MNAFVYKYFLFQKDSSARSASYLKKDFEKRVNSAEMDLSYIDLHKAA